MRDNGVVAEPVNLGKGWAGFDYEAAFGKPTRVVNDAAMQALGSYEGGKMLFLGLGTGLGSSLAVDGRVAPMELGHLPYRKSTFEDYVGEEGLRRRGLERWNFHVEATIAALVAALQPEYVVLGGGNARKLKELPDHVAPRRERQRVRRRLPPLGPGRAGPDRRLSSARGEAAAATGREPRRDGDDVADDEQRRRLEPGGERRDLVRARRRRTRRRRACRARRPRRACAGPCRPRPGARRSRSRCARPMKTTSVPGVRARWS